jgi:broad specificity polyphosphatase/5'/3'-nucleotidase SurE
MEQSMQESVVVAPVVERSATGVAISTLVESLKTSNGGWTKESLALLGVPWPPPRGWKKRLERVK